MQGSPLAFLAGCVLVAGGVACGIGAVGTHHHSEQSVAVAPTHHAPVKLVPGGSNGWIIGQITQPVVGQDHQTRVQYYVSYITGAHTQPGQPKHLTYDVTTCRVSGPISLAGVRTPATQGTVTHVPCVSSVYQTHATTKDGGNTLSAFTVRW